MTHQPYVGIYWTRPVPRAGFVSLSADVDIAANQSLTIHYQRDLARRHVRVARGAMIREIALLELAPDRASQEAVMAIERLVETSAGDAIFLTVDFSHEVNWRPHRFLWAALPVERRQALTPDAMLIDGKAFNPSLHFRAWQSDDEAHRAGKDNHRSLLLAALAGREDRSWTEKADHLNGVDLRTHGGKRWTADNLRKFIGPASGDGGPDKALRT
ncbi:hypothetical protein PANO111632_13215 [Paracoccus nototheniae]|uniref:Recombinase n=1 Tax=Paracoccus nototheniae TaxID=2489002 RepID=A0ABW4DUF3_9RHOB|nr:hypothetical protein [Paracoccus nototheniae]